jgi:phage terminase Nu1 subunit (DNA packaging protein)
MNPAHAPQRLAVRRRKAAALLDISVRHLDQLTKDGLLPCTRVGAGKRKTVLYSVAVLEAWLARQAAPAGGER